MSVIIPNSRLELQEQIHQFPYRLDDFQINGCYATQNNNNVLITAHTAAGKTTIAEYAIALSLHLGKKVLYTSPIKTLSNQKYFDFKKSFDNVGILTGDIKLNPEAQIIVLTTEILRNKLDHEIEELNDVHCVIFDEVHYFNDPERGFVWEECITKLPKHILLVMLSATIDKAQDFATWVAQCRQRDCYLIGTTWRPVPLNHYIYTNDDILMINKHKSGVITENVHQSYKFFEKKKIGKTRLLSLSEFLEKKGLFPAICFSFSRKKCVEYCAMLKRGAGFLNNDEKKITQNIIRKIFSTNLYFYKDLPSTIQLLEFINYGIAIHHSGLLPIQKEIVEILFSKGLIKFLFATETFAVGVNMPTKSVIFTSLSKFDGTSDYPRILRYDEFMQMSGRAGRRGKDEQGLVIYCPLKDLESKNEVIGLLKGKAAKLQSQYDEGANTFLRLLNSNPNNADILDFYKSTLFGKESEKNVISIQQELSKLEGKIAKHPVVTISDEEYEIIQELKNATNPKKIKQIKKKFTSNISNYIDNEDELNKLKSNVAFLKECINKQTDAIANKLFNISGFNAELDLVKEQDGETIITSYGKIVASLSNCSEIILGKVIQQKALDNVDWKTIGILLSCFATEKRNNSDISETDIWEHIEKILNKDCIKLLNNTWDYYNNIIEYFEEYHMNHRMYMSFQFVEPFMMWINKEPLINILEKYGNFDGNFVKNIYKIRDICQEILKVCQNFNLGELQEKINTLLENLIYGIGEFNSLYIHHYDLIQ